MAEESERAALIRGMFSSAESSRSRPAAELYSEDTKLLIPLGIDEGLYQGREAVAAYWRQFGRTWRTWRGDITSLTELGQSVHITVEVTGRAGGEQQGGIPAEARLHYCAYFVGEKIAAATFYADWMTPAG